MADSASVHSKASGSKVKSTLSRAEIIQQRDQLRQMVLSKFIAEYGKNNKKFIPQIEQTVDEFFRSERVTEAGLKKLKAKILDLTKAQGLTQSQ